MSYRYSSVTGSKPNFDAAVSYNGPDLSEMFFEDAGSTTDKKVAKSAWRAGVTAVEKQPYQFHECTVTQLTSGLYRCDLKSDFVPVVTDAETGYDTDTGILSVQTTFWVSPLFDTATTVWERLEMNRVQLISAYSSNVPDAASKRRLAAILAAKSFTRA